MIWRAALILTIAEQSMAFDPTSAPTMISVPTQVPMPSPTEAPTSATNTTKAPVFAPTQVPMPSPTEAPTPAIAPTNAPVASPVPAPTASPVKKPPHEALAAPTTPSGESSSTETSSNAGAVVGAVLGSLLGLSLIAAIAYVAFARPPWAEGYVLKIESFFQKDGGSSSGYAAHQNQSPLLDGEDFN